MSAFQLFILETFLLSVYITSFQIDLFLIQTSNGKQNSNLTHHSTKLNEHEKKLIRYNFLKWRKNIINFKTLGSVFLALSLVIQLKFQLIQKSTILVLLITALSFLLQNKIIDQLDHTIRKIRRDQVNTYSILSASTQKIKILFQVLIVSQRVSLLFLCFTYAWDQSITMVRFVILGVGILIMVLSQKVKFYYGDHAKLMILLEENYFDENTQPEEDKRSQCSICLKRFEYGQKIKLLPCSKEHIFHSQCFQNWRRIKTQCPLCRYQLSQYL